MERQMTATTEITIDPGVSGRFLGLMAAVVGGAALLVAILLTTGSGTDVTAELKASDGARWQAIADSFELEASSAIASQAASAARLTGLAASFGGLSQATVAASDRLTGLADMLAVAPAPAGPINTAGASYDPVAGSVVYPSQYGLTITGTTAAERIQALQDSLLPSAEVGPINTVGATYDPVAGTVVFQSQVAENANSSDGLTRGQQAAAARLGNQRH